MLFTVWLELQMSRNRTHFLQLKDLILCQSLQDTETDICYEIKFFNMVLFIKFTSIMLSLTYQVEIFLWPNSLRWSACILEIFLFNILTIFNGNFQKISRPRLGSHTIGLVTHWLDCPGNQPRPLSLVEIPPSSVIWSIKGWDHGVATPALLCHKDSKSHTSSAPLWRLPWERCGPGVESGGESYKCKWGGHITTGWFTLWG